MKKSAILLLLIASAVTACTAGKVVYDYDYGYHTVLIGETLYSISWQHRLDYRQLADWNSIEPPYTIYAGQRLRLTPPLNSANHARKNKPPIVSKSSVSTSSTMKSTAQYPSTRNLEPEIEGNSVVNWMWPLKGKVLSTFAQGSSSNKGIDIGGRLGDPVVAASGGKVVYSGDGLVNYGNLIIVKHNERYLSAYAHNKKLLVQEGAVVKQGQRIAELGNTGTSVVKLHFQIRESGKPVDPLRFLPKL